MSLFTSPFGGGDAPPLRADTDGVSVVVATKTAQTQTAQPQTAAGDGWGGSSTLWGGAHVDPVALVLEAYTLSLVTAPLVVVETLQELQHQHARADDAADDDELAAYDALAPPPPPPHVVPRLRADVWANVRALAAFKTLGTLGLVKGHFTTFLHAALTRATLPVLEEALNDALDVFDDTHPATALVASVVVAAALSPLELIRTRLIAQSPISQDDKKKYYGPFHAAAAIHATEELYPAAHVYPTIVCRGLSSLLQSLSRTIIMHDLGLHPEYNPLAYTTAVLVFLAAEVFVVTPFELARKRIQAQSLKPARLRKAGEAVIPFASCVELSTHKRYDGIFDVIRRVLTEEGAAYSASSSSPSSADAAKKAIKIDEYEDPFASPSSKKGGDWQDLYTSPTRNARSSGSQNRNGKSGFTKSWDGLRSLYRGYWTRYSIRVVEFAFEGMRDVGDSAWDI
ncbi:mitochondrial carrier domain-containing protein [Obelidium mucronatum]|nr:mitochondrial carrier domain-containing protein [Obelidium mucronatum]